jgi:hypothetical protein
MILAVEFVTDLVSSANKHGRWRDYAARVKRHREIAKTSLFAAARNARVTPKLPCTVTMTRMGIRLLDGHENLAMSFKHVVDGIACKPSKTRPAGFFEVDDADPRFTWVYKQKTVPRAAIGPILGQSRVRIELQWEDP